MRRTDFAYHEQRNPHTGFPEANHYYRPAQRDTRNVKAAKNGLWAVFFVGLAFSVPLWLGVIQDHWPRIVHAIERLAR